MDSKIWEMSETPEFVDDVAHYAIPRSRVDRWRRNIQRNPLIGDAQNAPGNLSLFDYEVDEYIVTYILIPEKRWIELMTIRPLADERRSTAERLTEIGKDALDLAVKIARLIGVFK